jgi:hypothetical protein
MLFRGWREAYCGPQFSKAVVMTRYGRRSGPLSFGRCPELPVERRVEVALHVSRSRVRPGHERTIPTGSYGASSARLGKAVSWVRQPHRRSIQPPRTA